MLEILLSIVIGLAIANVIIMALGLGWLFFNYKIFRELLNSFESSAVQEAQRILRERGH